MKTRKTGKSVSGFLAGVKDGRRRRDCRVVAKLMKEVTRKSPRMWGGSIVGYGDIRYKGRSSEGDWFMVGFSPRSAATVVYLSWDLSKHRGLLKKLGPHTHGKGCLYLKSLEGVDLKVLRKLIRAGCESARAMNVAK